MSSYFITGTDTGVGKTLIAAALIRLLARTGRRVVGMKPVASGCRQTGDGLRNDDAELLMAQASVSVPYAGVNPYAFEPAIAPHLAAREAGIRIELETILDTYETLAGMADSVIVEGVGGWRVPLGRVITTEHMARTLNLPVVLVVGLRLGCLNHALLTIEAINQAGLPLAGWVANYTGAGIDHGDDMVTTLTERTDAPLIGVIPYCDHGNIDSVAAHVNPDRLISY